MTQWAVYFNYTQITNLDAFVLGLLRPAKVGKQLEVPDGAWDSQTQREAHILATSDNGTITRAKGQWTVLRFKSS